MATLAPKVPVAPFRERSVRTTAQWTPTQLRAAYAAAEAGNLMRLADLVDATLEDDRVSGTLHIRTAGLLGLPLEFDLEPDNQRMREALANDFWTGMPEAALAQVVTWGVMLGVGLAQLQWQQEVPDRGGRWLPRLQVWHPRWLRWDENASAWKLQTANAGEIVIDPDDPQWWLHLPHGGNRPWRSAAVRAVAPWWLLKRYALQDWGTYGEAHGNPTRVATAPAGASKELRREVAEDLQDIAGRTGMALPDGFNVQILEATARTWETFRAQIEVGNAGIAITILGQTLTTEVKSGSLAAAQIHDLVRHDLIDSDAQTLSTSLHHGPVRWWAAFNFGTAEPAAPWPRWDTTPPEDATATAETSQAKATALKAIAEALREWRQLGVPLDLEKIAEEHKIPVADLEAAVAAFNAGGSESTEQLDEAFAQRILRTHQLAQRLAEQGVDVAWPHIITGEAAVTAPGAYLQAAAPRTSTPQQQAAAILANRLTGQPPVLLASRDDPRGAAGFVRGALYLAGLERRLDAIQPFKDAVRAIAQAVEESTSYDELLEKIPTLFEQLDPDTTAPLMEALMLADLAGRLAAEEDL